MSVRDTILDNLATQLATITDVEDVLRKVPTSEELPSDDPYLVIVDTAPDLPKQYCDGNKKRYEMTITILAIVRGATNDSPPSTEISDIISDIRELIYTPISLGANVRFVEEAGVQSIFTDNIRASVHYQIIIDYWFDADSP
jgi:hypothetical protein